MSKSILLSGLILLLVASCHTGNKPSDSDQSNKEVTAEQLYQVNQYLVRQDASAIKAEAARRNWNLTETPTGLFYELLKKAKETPPPSRKIIPGMRVELAYSIELMDGTPCYSSNEEGPKQFLVEKTEAERGLHEAVQLFGPGDSILLIVPPQLAFGLMGDGNRIPARAILVYHIKILSAE